MSVSHFSTEIKNLFYLSYSISDVFWVALVTGVVTIVSVYVYQAEETKRALAKEQTKRMALAAAKAPVNALDVFVVRPLCFLKNALTSR